MRKTVLSINPSNMDAYASEKEDDPARLDPIWSLDVDRNECELTFTLVAESGSKNELIELNTVHTDIDNEELFDAIDENGLDAVLGGEVFAVIPTSISLDMDGMVIVEFSIGEECYPPYRFVFTTVAYEDYTIVANVWRNEALEEQYYVRITKNGRVIIGREE